MEGKLKHWNEDKGFGFIAPTHEAQDIFIHISTLKKMARHPVVGDIITFDIHTDNTGKKRATNAQIKGVALINNGASLKNKNKKSNKLLSNLIFFFLLVIVGLGIYFGITQNIETIIIKEEKVTIAPIAQKNKIDDKAQFSCEGKVYCSEMSSCQEAKFYIENCEGTKMDGNKDGVPCESQWCK